MRIPLHPTYILTNQDVQLTKDNVPIIYHDFLMSETGIDAPLYNLNLEQVLLIPQQTITECVN